MTSFYTHFHYKGNMIFLRLVENGKRKIKIVKDFKPSLFLETKEESKYKTLEGKNIKRLEMESISEAKKFIEQYKDVKGFNLYGNTNWDYSYINERWKNEIKFDEKQILVYYLDIEVEISDEFPDVEKAKEPVNVLTIFNGEKFLVWLYRNAEPKIDHSFPVELRCFDDEKSMLRDFVSFWKNDYPDVLTGWNIEGFDLIYIINRIKKVLGEEYAKKLSPVESLKEVTIMANKAKTYKVKGIEILDYMLLFKKFIPGEREFTLDSISEEFLGEKKLENPYSSFKEFYEKDWDLFVDYNIRDVHLVYKLEQKLKLLSLTYSIAYLVKMNYSDVFGTVKPWDIFIQNSLFKENRFVKATFSPSKEEKQIMGGFVLDPKPGKYEWVVSFDANSLYPSIIRTWNISPETILKEEEIPQDLREYHDRILIDEFLKDETKIYDVLQILKKHNLTMTLNGQFFRKDKQGIMPYLSAKVYEDRVKAKNEMKIYKKKIIEEKDENVRKELEAKIASLDNKQLALKILLNSLYGSFASPYFRFFDNRMAEGITSTGQFFIQKIGKMTSEYLDSLSGKKDSLVYIDTDSNYFSLKSLIEKFKLNKLKKEKLIDAIDKICSEKIGKKIEESCKFIGDILNVYDNKLEVKREKICESAIWVSKKRYALYSWDNEGVRYKEPEIFVTGLEVKRSNSSKLARENLEKALKIVLIGKEEELQKFVKETKQKFYKLDLATIAMPSGVKGLEKYSDAKAIYKKGTPQHVRASLLYNFYLNKFNLMGKYNPILEGAKMKRVILKLPNPISEDVIGFIDVLPNEFGLEKYIDYEELFNKTFISPLERIVDAVGWNIEKKSSLEDFF